MPKVAVLVRVSYTDLVVESGAGGFVRVSFADLVVECGAGGRPGEGVSY